MNVLFLRFVYELPLCLAISMDVLPYRTFPRFGGSLRTSRGCRPEGTRAQSNFMICLLHVVNYSMIHGSPVLSIGRTPMSDLVPGS